MEQLIVQGIGVFILGVVSGAAGVLIYNKLRSGTASPAKLREEYEQYQADVESHFEQTSKKFQAMTEQYQELYQHLSVGATSLCRPDSDAAAMVGKDQAARISQQKSDTLHSSVQPNAVEANAVETKPKSVDKTPDAAKKNANAVKKKPDAVDKTGAVKQESSSAAQKKPAADK